MATDRTAVWTREQAARAADQPGAALPEIGRDDVVAVDPARDLWDMWPIADRAGRTVIAGGREWWFFLAVDLSDDPEARHDAARIHLYSHGGDGWRHHGAAFPEGFAPGSRQWSGSAVLADDGRTLSMHFTAAGSRDGGPHFAQRLFETTGRFESGAVGGWSDPVETVQADGRRYRVADQGAAVDGRIKGFRDPGYLRDPRTGREHLLFTGSAPGAAGVHDGLIGLATRRDGRWVAEPPILSAAGVNCELERPHLIVRGGLYYLFWSTQAKRFAPGIGAPTGLYGMVSDGLRGGWRPLNGSGLVAANPAQEPFQAYCWWVTGELEVISFVDYWGVKGASAPVGTLRRRARFGGTVAPSFPLLLDGDRAEFGTVRQRIAA